MKKYIIPIAIPYEKRNCVNQIVTKYKITKDDVRNIIEEHLKKIDDTGDIVQVAFSGVDTEKKQEFIDVAYEYVRADKINEIRILTRANYINRKFLKKLKRCKVKVIELEVPSTNEYILNKSEFEYTMEDIKKAAKLIRRRRFDLGLDMMIGLPDSTKIDDINTAKNIIKMKPKIVGITPTLVLKGAKLEEDYKTGEYKPLALVQAIETSEELVEIFNSKGINVIAIGYGLVDTDTEQLEIAEQVVDGPFHPAFRELVETSLWYNAIVNKIKKLNVKVMQVEVKVNSQDVNNVIGYKQENINKLKDLYDVELIVTADDSLKQGKSKIEVTKTYKDFSEK